MPHNLFPVLMADCMARLTPETTVVLRLPKRALERRREDREVDHGGRMSERSLEGDEGFGERERARAADS